MNRSLDFIAISSSLQVQTMKDSVNQPSSKPNKVQFIEMPEQEAEIEIEPEESPTKSGKSPPNEKSSPPALAPSISIDACEEAPAPVENDVKSGEGAGGDGKGLLTKP